MPHRDFTLDVYSRLLYALSIRAFLRFVEFCTTPTAQSIVLRHDVDALPQQSLQFAQLQHRMGIRGTYYFRIVPESFHPEMIVRIAEMGHEIGYHYEDVSLAAAAMKSEKKRIKEHERFQELVLEKAIESFAANLAILRRYADIRTICMHGSPLSRWDSRLLWSRYSYRDFSLIGEPYLDIDFNHVAYYTDTGRQWDGDLVSLRDKVNHGTQKFPKFHSTFDLINSAKENTLPDRIMFTFHPQRWTDEPLPWVRELVLQNIKNTAKYTRNKWMQAQD